MVHLEHEAAESLALPEPGEEQLVDGDYRKAGQCDLKCLVMEDRDAKQRQAKQNEINRDAEQVDWLCRVDTKRGCCRGWICEQDAWGGHRRHKKRAIAQELGSQQG